MKRTTISLDDDLLKDIALIKRKSFYDKTYAELYRAILRVGAKQLLKKGNK